MSTFEHEDDAWGRLDPANNDHSAIEIVHKEDSQDGLAIYHPDELEASQEAWILAEPGSYFSVPGRR